MSCFISTFICRRYCTTCFELFYSSLAEKDNLCSKSTSQWTYHRKSLTYFTFLMLWSCYRGTQTGNHRCRYQVPTHVKTNPNLHGTISPTTCTSIKYPTCKISNPRQTHDISPSDFKGAQSEATIHNTCWLIFSDIPAYKNLSESGYQQRELYTGGAEYQGDNR